ncbi:RING finger and CHY zinc finger domain-containing protein 1 [Catharus ustulatus]|nr:RING finger and CHY zinc finger domain-containing protein 1 [Catharus ustulatus]
MGKSVASRSREVILHLALVWCRAGAGLDDPSRVPAFPLGIFRDCSWSFLSADPDSPPGHDAVSPALGDPAVPGSLARVISSAHPSPTQASASGEHEGSQRDGSCSGNSQSSGTGCEEAEREERGQAAAVAMAEGSEGGEPGCEPGSEPGSEQGCEHYRRGCRLRAPCCGKLYPCRLCHDGAEQHQLDRFRVSEVQCSRCRLLQKAQQRCEGCDNLFGEYYCDICHLFDRDKKQYHCEECGICRIGPKEDFFHCSKCNLCLSLSLQGKHKCIENVSRQDCPICLEDIHTSRVGAHVLPCGHLLHRTCYDEMLKEGYRCPLCMHSALDMTRYWRQLDNEVAQTPMPTEYQNMMVEILCNDCNARSTVQFHLLGMKCQSCESYNTAQDGRCRLSLEEQ